MTSVLGRTRGKRQHMDTFIVKSAWGMWEQPWHQKTKEEGFVDWQNANGKDRDNVKWELKSSFVSLNAT